MVLVWLQEEAWDHAGHTFIINGQPFKVRMLPSAALNTNTKVI
jgi:adenylosuccinate synthase